MAFVAVARAEEIPEGHGAFLERGGLAFAVFNAGGGRFHATGPICPHEDGPLSEGWIESGAVICPWHGFDFDVATGACRASDGLSIAVYRTRVSNGIVEVELP